MRYRLGCLINVYVSGVVQEANVRTLGGELSLVPTDRGVEPESHVVCR